VPPRDEREISNDVTAQNISFPEQSVCSTTACANELLDTFHRVLNGVGKILVPHPGTYMGREDTN